MPRELQTYYMVTFNKFRPADPPVLVKRQGRPWGPSGVRLEGAQPGWGMTIVRADSVYDTPHAAWRAFTTALDGKIIRLEAEVRTAIAALRVAEAAEKQAYAAEHPEAASFDEIVLDDTDPDPHDPPDVTLGWDGEDGQEDGNA